MKNFFKKKEELRAPSQGRWSRMVFRLSFLCALLASSGAYAGTALSGTYTVCTSGCDYSTVQAAVNDLMNNGVSGPTTIHIKSGSYNELVKMTGPISGASATNRITFLGDGKYGTSKTRIYYAFDAKSFYMKSVNYVTIDNLDIEASGTVGTAYPGSGALYMQVCKYVIVRNCLLIGTGGGQYDNALYAGSCANNVYEKNRMEGGFNNNSYDFYSGTSTVGSNDTIRNNVLVKGNNYAYHGYYGSGHQFYSNRIDSSVNQFCQELLTDQETSCSYHDNFIKGAYWPLFLSYPNGGATASSTAAPFMIYNNMIVSTGYYCSYGFDYNPAGNRNVHILHNTFYKNTSGTAMYFHNDATYGYDIRNNNFYSGGSGSPLLDFYSLGKSTDQESGNNFYIPSGSLIAVNGVTFNTLSSYQAALAGKGLGVDDHSINTSFASPPYDLHYKASTTLPWGKYAGISKDFDGDSRCLLFPTAGADEGATSIGKPTSSFTGPKDSIFDGYIAIFKNSASPTEPKVYRWYVDGKFVSDSIDLVTTAVKYPSSVVSLVTVNCDGKDSINQTFTAYQPHKAPKTDFISDVNVIRSGQVVTFTDLTPNYPSSWAWDVTPKMSGSTPNFKFVTGDSTKPNVRIQFYVPGKYKVCLTTSNSKGAGGTVCKNNYVEVSKTFNLATSTAKLKITEPRGYIYDDGGPNDAYGKGIFSASIVPPCSKTLYLVFTQFDVKCGYDYVRIWDGADPSTAVKEITTCTANSQNNYGPGFTGGPSSSCTSTGVVCTPKITDTFVATSGKMFIQMNNNQGNGAGFEAYYWSDPKVLTPPVASFSVPDTLCTNASVDFISTSQGEDLSYQWDFDEDLSYFEDTHANSAWGFPFNGPHTITLIVSNCGGVDTFQKTVYVKGPPKPKVAFHTDNPYPTTNDIVYLFPDISQCVDGYSWKVAKTYGSAKVTYVNGTNSGSAIPQVMLGDTGCYTVSLTATNATGTDQLTKSCYLFVKKPYCVPTITTTVPDLGITEVQLNGMDNKSKQTGGYENYIPTVNATVETGITYPITISRATAANEASRAIYIDWNNDGDFTDTMELVAVESPGQNLSWTDSITIPAVAKIGATVMRIAITKAGQTPGICGSTFGEYEDYRLYISRDKTKPVITLLGADTIKVEQGYSFTDPGATALDNLSGNITKFIKVSKKDISTGAPFDNLVAGTYIFTYTVQDAAGNDADPRHRIVIVTPDKTKPNLTVSGGDTLIYGVYSSYTEPTASAFDLVDGDLTDSIHVDDHVPAMLNVVDTYTVSYMVSDASGNLAKKNITVIVADTSAPVLHLIGPSTIYHNVNTAYTDSGVTYTDNYYTGAKWDSIMYGRIIKSENIQIDKVGTYYVNYTLTDPSGNKSVTVTRTVIVQDTVAPMVNLIGNAVDTIEVNTKYFDLGIHISDNYYYTFTVDTLGTFYDNFKDGRANKLGLYTITFKVTDGSGNVTSVTRSILVADRTAPVVKLIGNAVVNVCRWQSYTDSGVTVTDNYWDKGHITVTKEGTFLADTTQKEGGFYIVYKAVDGSGNVGYSNNRVIYVAAPGTADCSSSIAQGKDIDRYVTIYPNPSEGLFTVSSNLPQQKQVRITVSNMLGQQVAVISNQVLGNNQFQIDLRGQAAGVYLVNIYTDKQVVTKRITITK